MRYADNRLGRADASAAVSSYPVNPNSILMSDEGNEVREAPANFKTDFNCEDVT